jgi:formate dehydrogenase iron-sulfur subunit
VGRSRGTLPFQLAGNVAHGGLVEPPSASRCASCRRLRRRHRERPAGPRGAGRRPARRLSAGERCSTLPLDYEASPPPTAMIGHGGIVVFDDTVDMAQHGALRDGVLRHRVLRQVHALPHRRPAASR